MLQPIVHPAQPLPPMRSFAEDFTWQEPFIPEIASIVGRSLLRSAPVYLDRNENVDLTLRLGTFSGVSCRVRRFPFLLQYPNDITIRAARPSGAATEIDKLNCSTSHYFYRFSNQEEVGLAAWTLLNFVGLRDWYGSYKQKMRREPGTRRQNRDGTEFIVLDLHNLPPDIIVDRQGFGDAAW